MISEMIDEGQPVYLAATEAGKILGVSRRSLYTWRDREGAKRYFLTAKGGRLVLVDVPGLVEWARANDRGPRDAWWRDAA